MIMENTLFLNVGTIGVGDYFFAVAIAIYLKNKYENIYILYSAVHFNGMMYIVNRLLEENNITNITCIGDKIYKNDNCKPPSKYFTYTDEISSEICDKFYRWRRIEVDENKNEYIFMNCMSVENLNSGLIISYDTILDYYNINMTMLKNSIQFKLNSREEIENNNIYQKFTDSINNEKYILVFHCIEREQYNFSFRDYPNDFNKNKYKIINVCKRNNDCSINQNNEYYFGDLINYFPPMYNLHKIIENAEDLHFIDSYPLHYFNFMFKNINNFKVYNRWLSGFYTEDNSFKTNIKFNNNSASAWNINVVGCGETYYPINYFKNISDHEYLMDKTKFIKFRQLINHFNYPNWTSQPIHEIIDKIDLNEHFIKFEEIINDENHSLYKVLPLNICNSNIGICTKTLSNDIKFIEVNLSEVKNTKELYISIDKIIEEINCLNNKSLNILLVKTTGDYILKIKPLKEKNQDGIIELDTNYENIEKSLIDITDHYLSNKSIHYIYPYGNDEDRNNFTEKLIKTSCKAFSNRVKTDYQFYKV
jgi:hypothetical protein